jgi:ATP-dependent protease ClpP protease subunit
MKKIFLIFGSCLALCLQACADYHISPIEKQTVYVTSDKTETILPQSKTVQKTPIPSQAIINFVGKITAKKTNELTSYIHKQLNEGVKNFILNINSGGGDADAAIAAFQYLKQLPINIATYNTGNVQSSAALLYCSGEKRYALPEAFFMLHGSSTMYNKGMSLVEVESLLKLGKIHLQAFVNIMATCANVDKSLLEHYFSSADAKYFTVNEAQEIGLVHEIAAPPFLKNAHFYNITD